MPLASNLHVLAGQTIANPVMVKVPDSGIVWFYDNAGTVHVVGDLVGVVTRAAPGGFTCGCIPIGAAAQPMAPDAPVAGAVGVRLGSVDTGRWS